MTSYSIFTATDATDTDEVNDARTESFVHGVARTLLDLAEIGDGTEESYAELWHTPAAGWEIEAIERADRVALRARVQSFVDANRADIDATAHAISVDASRPAYVTSVDAAYYRAGELFTHTVQGSGIGLWEYGDAGQRLSDVIRDTKRGLSAYADVDAQYAQLTEI